MATKNCSVCGHKLSLHTSADSVLVRAVAPAGWYDDGSGRQRWWDGQRWGAFKDEPPLFAAESAVAQVESVEALDSYAKLLQLVELRAQGALTADEFREAKRQALGL